MHHILRDASLQEAAETAMTDSSLISHLQGYFELQACFLDILPVGIYLPSYAAWMYVWSSVINV